MKIPRRAITPVIDMRIEKICTSILAEDIFYYKRGKKADNEPMERKTISEEISGQTGQFLFDIGADIIYN